ncbi:MAG TPA: hypothetical protein VJH23_06080, partial [archaeon]|nr:hypothetical protein [archaeon]
MRYLLLAVAFLIIMLASAFSDSQDLNAIDANSLEGGTEVFPQDQNPVPLGGGEVDLNGEATPLPPEDQNTIPPNVDTLPPPDENATPPEAIEEPLQPSSRSLIFVTPLAEQVISGVQVVIVSLQNFINVTAQWFSFNGEDFNGTLLENTLSADLNTLSAPNGPYILTANACEDSNCYAGSLVVSVLNELPPSDEQILDENTVVPQQDEPLQGETLYYLRPSNVFSALSIFGSDEDLVDSGAEFAAVPAGTYSAKIEFLGNEAIEDAMFTGLVVDSNATLIEYSELQVSPLMKRFFEPVSAFSITSSATYSEVDIILAVPEKSSALYFCQEQERGDCRENWEKITEIGDEEMVSVSEFGIYAFGTFGEESVREFFANILGKRGQPKFFVKSLKSSYFEQDAELGFIAAGGKEGRVRFGDFKRMLRIRELQLREDGEPLAHGSFSTPVVAVDSPDGVGAEITLPTTGPVNAIMKCDGWDFGSSSCATEWVATEIEFAQSPDSITFLANSFSAYGGAEITVVNVQSYPVVGGEWVVRFTTKGKADLRITPIEGTTWSSDSETEDLKFLSLKCGDAEKTVAWDGITAVFEDYQCAKTGFETSQVFTPGRHALLFEFGESSAIARNLAGDIGVLIASTRTANSVATATPEVLVSIPAASFTTDANYMIFASVHVKGSDGSARDQTVIRHGGSQFTNVLEQQENQGASTDQWVYSAITKWTAVNGEDIDLHGQCLVSSDTCTYDEIFLMAIPLDALTENVDWLYVEDTDALSNMNDTFSSNVGAQITFTPDGTSDYLVFSNSRILIDAAGNNVARMELHDGSSQLALVERDGENTADQSVLSVLHVLQAPSASSKTYSLRFQGDSSDDHSSSRLFILRMSAFKNSDANVVNETYAITNSTSVRSTLSMSLAADGNVVAFYGAAFANALGTPASNKVSVTAREGSNVRVQSSGTELTSWNAVANTEGADRLFAALFDSFNIADASSHTYDVAVLGQTTTGTNRHDNKQAIVAVFSTRFADGSLSFSIANPPSDGNTTINVDTNFLVSGTTTCSTNNCGLVDTNLQYCVGSGCSNWVDMNTVSTSPLYIASGSQPQSSTIGKDQSYNASWIVRSTVAQDYELRLRGDGANTDANVTNGTDRTITTQAGGAADYSFTLSLPSSGCTQGKGSIDAGTSCDKGYFEASASGGTADANGVNPEGQTSTIPFFVYDNQSTEANDLNISLDLNAVLPSTLKLKAGMLYDGWAPVCSASGIDADISGNGNNADINYGIVTAGVSGNALGFSGIDRANGMNIDSGDVNMVVPISGDGNASVSFWFRADSNNSNRVLFLKPIQYIDRNGTI